MIGETLAHYQITSLLGKGGMGEVYRALDTKLDREVAIKILPPETSRDPERIARFAREARTLASLNHANIAGLFGLEQHGDRRFLVMELVEGEDLRERLERGPLPLDDALDVARQLAEGLEEAHEKGIVHRDLKPANVKVTPEGRVKILDFGLARAMLGEGIDEGELGNSPTITAAMTAAGTVLGTAAYMSPEQARGKAVDRRADLWAFGVILWELITGRRLFEGETVSDTLAAVLRAEPAWDELPADLPPGVRRLLQRCLERDPRKRLRDIGEARVRLERWRDDPSTLEESASFVAVGDQRSRRWIPWAAAGVLMLAAVAGWLRPAGQAPSPAPPLRVALDLPDIDPPRGNLGSGIVISPDGRTLAYLSDGSIRIRPLDRVESTPVVDSENATSMAFSPDGKWLAFQSGGRIRRVSVSGGSPLDVCRVDDPRGLCWVDDGTIVFTANYMAALSIVSLETGEVRALTELDSAQLERSHRWPSPVPGRRAVLYMVQRQGEQYADGDIRVVEIETGESREVYRGATFPLYAGTGHLVFARDRTLVALEFDIDRWTTRGVVVPVLDNVATFVRGQEADDGSAQVAWSRDGLMVYRTAERSVSEGQVAWLDLGTGTVEPLGPRGVYRGAKLSPDERTLAISREVDGIATLFILDLDTRVERRFRPDRVDETPAGWSPDGRTLYWNRVAGGINSLVRQRVDRTRPEEVVRTDARGVLTAAISPDGRFALSMIWKDVDDAGWDLGLIDLTDLSVPPRLIAGGPGAQIGHDFSPDGRWIVMHDSRPGMRREVKIISVDDPALAWTVDVSTGEPAELHWAADGESIVFRGGEGLTIRSLPVDMSSDSPRLGNMRRVLPDPYVYVREFPTTDLARDGRRMIIVAPPSENLGAEQSRTVLVTDWFDELRRRMPSSR